ncbi:protein EVI2B [Sorex fumeus]|uniref:protein EVI2B n=1 Tax=Sorex fumeus TaxID=62283 RepID=UPI0024AD9A05|nr:protein EVI2B [Sorex fumeus]XP_055983945.1 protein EVI2B [Sorex fumeus]
MDPKYFILILFYGHLNNMISAETEAITTEKQSWSTLFRSSMSSVSENSQITTGNPLGQQTQFNNISSGQPVLIEVTTEKPTIKAASGKPEAYTSAAQTLVYNITRQPTRVNTSSEEILSTLTSSRLPPSTNVFTRQSPPFVYTSQPPALSAHTSRKSPTAYSVSTQSIPTVKNSPRGTPGFILNGKSNEKYPHKTNSTSIAAILIGVILTSMLLAITVIVLWKYLRKPVTNDQNWAGRSPFADGETPDICLDIRENDATTKRTSTVSLMAWKPSKHTLLADDLEIKLFESSENNEESSNPRAEKTNDQANGTSEDSGDGSTIGTAVSSSDDVDLFLPPPPPLTEAEGQERNQSDILTLPVTSPLPNESGNHISPLDCPNQVCEDNSEFKQSFPPPPDAPNLPLPEADLTENQDDSHNEIQSQHLEFSISLDSDEALDEALPPPPAELL